MRARRPIHNHLAKDTEHIESLATFVPSGTDRPWQKGRKSEPPSSSTVVMDTQKIETSAPPEVSIVLSLEQNEVLEMVKAGKNVFFTGSAGVSAITTLKPLLNLTTRNR